MTFRTEIKRWRKARGLSQSQAAAELAISVRTLQNWEIGHQTPHPDRAELLRARMKPPNRARA
jgi:DNA-binding transcriptional regulator YiaG